MKKKIDPRTAPLLAGDAVSSHEELLDELNYLRLENAYLKKLDALFRGERSAQAPVSERNTSE